MPAPRTGRARRRDAGVPNHAGLAAAAASVRPRFASRGEGRPQDGVKTTMYYKHCLQHGLEPRLARLVVTIAPLGRVQRERELARAPPRAIARPRARPAPRTAANGDAGAASARAPSGASRARARPELARGQHLRALRRERVRGAAGAMPDAPRRRSARGSSGAPCVRARRRRSSRRAPRHPWRGAFPQARRRVGDAFRERRRGVLAPARSSTARTRAARRRAGPPARGRNAERVRRPRAGPAPCHARLRRRPAAAPPPPPPLSMIRRAP